ncbi:MAG: alpha-L-rhamnosidase [Acidobacteriota bacterium]|nr:alpha-L-rhamnosidase [Acidobacteriota bacterium]
MTRLRSALALLLFALPLTAQTTATRWLDPTRGLSAAAGDDQRAQLPEEYLWTKGDVTALLPNRSHYSWNRPDLRVAPHYFRKRFVLAQVPAAATLYVAGPRQATIYLNGKAVAEFHSDINAPIGFRVFHVEVSAALRRGENTLAIQAVRGHGIVAAAGSDATLQLTYGEVLAVKLVPAAPAQDAPPLLYSDASWRSTTAAAKDWEQPGFDDSTWPAVQSLGPVESNIDFFQWNADAGMYAWPGYRGMSPWLRTYALPPAAVTNLYPGTAAIENAESLTRPDAADLRIRGLAEPMDADAPALLLDFGREVAGRLYVQSAADCPSTLSVAYGESEIEAMSTGLSSGQQGGNYLGTNLLLVPPHGEARGPKSAFRYARVRFLRGCATLHFSALRLEGIYYPVTYRGSFHSSDAQLDRIWETGAYTAHLCMQDDIWDAPKRDRGRWVGDLDVAGPVISEVFGDARLIEDTLRHLVPAKVEDVNGIPGYSALWITSVEGLYQRSGDLAMLRAQHDALLRVLAAMDSGLDATGTFTNPRHQWLFVDWAPELYASTEPARVGTQLQFVRGYQAAVRLLRAMGDEANAARYASIAQRVTSAALAMQGPGMTYGTGWQMNALATLALQDTSATDTAHRAVLWDQVLSHVQQETPEDPAITPYFGAYLLQAMSALGHDEAALRWIRSYWGAMLDEGATSLWENYDRRWPKSNPHLSLQADGTSGYFVSMAHGWSAGPTSWMMEHLLGVTPTAPGYTSARIAPRLQDLSFVEGTVPTPQGLIEVSLRQPGELRVVVPGGVQTATLLYHRLHPASQVQLLQGTAPCTGCARGAATDATFTLTTPGSYTMRELP